MIIKLDKDSVYSTFNVSHFEQIIQVAQNMAPSMVEYYLSDLASNNEDISYINKSEIQETVCFDEYTLYKDYNDEIYLEFVEKETLYETESFW